METICPVCYGFLCVSAEEMERHMNELAIEAAIREHFGLGTFDPLPAPGTVAGADREAILGKMATMGLGSAPHTTD